MADIEEVLSKIELYAKDLNLMYRGCSQTTLKALQDIPGFGNGEMFEAVFALAGDVAGSGEVCGVLLSAIMAVSLAFGRSELELAVASADHQRTMEVGYVVLGEFKKEFGSVRCKDTHVKLFGRYYNLRDPKDREESIASGHINRCSDVVALAAKVAAKAILEAGYTIK